VNEGGLKSFDVGHNGILLLLKLYHDYMTEKAVVFDEMSITVLKKALPVSRHINHGSLSGGSYTYAGGHCDTCADELTELSSLLPMKYRFTYFVDQVIQGKENVDKYKEFGEFIEGHLHDAIEIYEGLDDDEKKAFNMPEKYEPPEPSKVGKPDKEDGDGDGDGDRKAKTPGDTIHFCKVIKALYNLNGEPTKNDELVTFLPSKGDIIEGFEQLYRSDCIVSVKFDTEKLKVAHMEGGITESGFMARVMDHVREDIVAKKGARKLELKEKKESALSGMKKRKRSSSTGD
jgi:hypothetical protein